MINRCDEMLPNPDLLDVMLLLTVDITFKKELGFFELLSGVFNEFFFHLGKGISSRLASPENKVMAV